MSSSEIAVSVRDLSKAYTIAHQGEKHNTLAEALLSRARHPFQRTATEKFWALKDVNFEIKKGQVVGIIGRNGAGKSTLLKILSRITEPTDGRIDLYGRVGSLLEVGTGFHPELTGRENVYLNGAILGMSRPEIRRQFDAIVDFAGVEQFLDTPVKRYSSGMYVRLAFAVAAHLSSDILIVDEVLAVGDSEFQAKCLGKMRDVASDGRTVLFVSHNTTAIRRLCSQGLVLKSGQLVKAGTVEDCLAEYREAGAGSAGRICDHITRLHGDIAIERITLNGSEADEYVLAAADRVLTIEMTGVVLRQMRFDVELYLHDTYDNPLCFFAPAFDRGHAVEYSVGAFKLSRSVQLPRMNRGSYYLKLSLAEPNVEIWAEWHHAVRLQCEGAPTATGQVFDGQLRSGWFLLESAQILEKLPGGN